MLVSGPLRRLLLAGTCFCVYGNPVHPRRQYVSSTRDSNCDGQCASPVTPGEAARAAGVRSTPSDADAPAFGASEHVTGLSMNVGARGGAGTDGHRAEPKGTVPVTQAGNGGSHNGRSRPSEAGDKVRSERSEVEAEAILGSSSEKGEAQRRPEAVSELSIESERKPASVKSIREDGPVTSGAALTSRAEKQEMDMKTQRSAQFGYSATSTAQPQPGAYSPRATARESKRPDQENSPREGANSRASLPGLVDSLKDTETETSRQSPVEPPDSPARTQLISSSSSPQTSTPLSARAQEGGTVPALPDLLLPDIVPNATPRQDGPESLWTEAVRESGVDTVVPLSQDEATEGTMSSEALPLIFEPSDDVTPQGAAAVATLAPGSPQPLAAMATGGMLLSEADFDQLVTVETDSDGPSHTPPLLSPDWTSPWQTSGAELLEPISPSGPSISMPLAEMEPGLSEEHRDKGADKIQNLEETPPTSGPSPSSIQYPVTSVTKATHRPVSKSRSGLEEMESEEEPDEDEEDENTEESDEDESEEDLTETPKPASTRPPYSLIPPPPVWVQRNQGLMRSWVELIREKAGYVSGMLAPVGIGIAGALLIVGALYSIRMIHRKRRNSFKHQRRKVRQPEQPREPGTNRQDQAMLLADSSEDEF